MSSVATRLLDSMPVGRFHRRLLFITGIGWLFDSFDITLLSFVLAALGKEWHLAPGATGNIIAMSFLGMLIGAAFGGTLADRYGRRTVFCWSLIIYGVGTALCAAATNETQLLWLRLFVGLGLGSELPVVGAYYSELAPASVRGRLWVYLETFWAVGFFLGAVVSYFVIPATSWKVAFLIGALPALYAAYLRQALPESPRFLEKRGRLDEAREVAISIAKAEGMSLDALNEITKSTVDVDSTPRRVGTFRELWTGPFLKRTIMLWVLWFCIVYAYYGTNTWMPSLLAMRGFTLVKSFSYVAIMFAVQFPGLFLAAYIVDKIGRRATLAIYLMGWVIGCYMFGQSSSASMILVWGSFISLFNIGVWAVLYAYTPELYPTHLRGTGNGWAAGFGRIAGILGPMIVGQALPAIGQRGVFVMFSMVILVSALAVILLGEETMRRTLEEISEHKM